MHSIVAVQVLEKYRLKVSFDDGTVGVVDLSRKVGQGVFSAWKDPSFFEQVRIGTAGELAWGDCIDLCPDSLYLEITGKVPEDLFPALRREYTHA